MSKKQPVTIVRGQDGAVVRSDLTLTAARVELARLNAEAAEGGHRHLGESVRYELRSAAGLVIK